MTNYHLTDDNPFPDLQGRLLKSYLPAFKGSDETKQ